MARKWTEAQTDAIRARGGSLLVSAAAGSGKTAVLVERVLERLTDPVHPTPADRLLVVTFTRAAAAEMSARISRQIALLLEENPRDVHLQRQQILMARAHISTIHSFCGDLVREFFYKLDISPDFRILDDSEMAVLRADAIEEVLEDYYGRGDEGFLTLIDAFAAGRDDSRIVRTVDTLYDFVRSHPFPGRWLREKAAAYRNVADPADTRWGETVFAFAEQAADYALSITDHALALLGEAPEVQAAYRDAYDSDRAGLLALREAVLDRDWDAVVFRCSSFEFARLKALRGFSEDPVKLRVTAARDEVKAVVKRLADLFCASKEECAHDIERLAPLVEKLFEVTEAYSRVLDEKKAERRAADFGDLEHWTLRLLWEDGENGPVLTPEAEEIAARFDEVMVDEYQDTNEAQDRIFRAVSRREENLFMVGDVKQSIYGFRQAMPQIFLRRRASFPLYDREKDVYPASVVLDRNFRSAKGVTDAVNFVFRQLMSRETGDLDYGGLEELVPAASYPDTDEPAVELELLDLAQAEEDEALAVQEARRIAALLLEKKETLRVFEDGEERPMRWSDTCILLRSANRFAYEYARELQRLGVPARADASGGFFAAREVSLALSLLRVVDNPLLDIPLAAVLMSPVYGFTADDLARVRLCDRRAPLYLAVRRASEKNEALAAFLRELAEFRGLAAALPSNRLLAELYDRTKLPELVQAMSGGELRLANLRLLLEYAGKYEESGHGGLSGFLRFLDRLERKKADLAVAQTPGELGDAVRVMSIHRSKGLEFPVCVLAGCSRRFNKERGEVLLHPELGLGVRLPDEETGVRYDVLPRQAAALELDRDEMSEELRVLYVAMTRAKQKLILLAGVKDADRTLERLVPRLRQEEKLPPYTVRTCASIADWLLLCALRHPSGGELRDRAGALPGIALPADEPWLVRITRPEPVGETRQEEREAESPDEKSLARLRERLSWRYPGQALAGVPSKVAASDLAERGLRREHWASSRPAFLGKGGLTPAERGTALHQFLQFANWEAARVDPQAELSRLDAARYLTPEQAAAVDLSRVRAFFASPLAKRIFDSPRVLREYRFTSELPAGAVREGLSGDDALRPVILQGVVDCAFEEDGALVVLDFKTDRVPNLDTLLSRYRGQLALYQGALARCTGLPVRECVLYSFHLGAAVSFSGEEENNA